MTDAMNTYVKVRIATGVGTADRWRSQYLRNGGWIRTVTGDSSLVYDRLCDLGPTPSIEAVAQVIGNKAWSYIRCDGCGERVEIAIEYAEAGDKAFCRQCVEQAAQALALFTKSGETP